MSRRLDNQFNTVFISALTIAIVLFTSSVGFSAGTYAVPQTTEVTLAWDPNDPVPDGYHIYQRTDGQAYDYSQSAWTGSATSGTIYNLEWDTTYYFVVRAYAGTLESADSEEVSFTAASPEPATYSISVIAGDHGAISPGDDTVVVLEGSERTFTIAPDAGYQIANVTVDGLHLGALSSYTFAHVAADHTIEATFVMDPYTISASAGDNGDISPLGNSEVNHGASKAYTITPDDGYRIVDVRVDGASKGAVGFYTFNNVASDHTIRATFAVKTYTITASAGANGSINPTGSRDINHGASRTYTMTPSSGYHIAQVLVDGQAAVTSATHIFSNVTENHTISVNFEADVLTLTARAEEGGSISPSGERTVNPGASQTYTLTADNGYEIQAIMINGQSRGAHSSYTLENISTDCTIEARFSEVINQAPTADAGPDQTVDEDQEVTLNGLNSMDIDDGIAKFQWRQIQGDDVNLSATDQPEITFTAPHVDSSGTSLVFELTVTDYSQAVNVDTCIVNVTHMNVPPTAEAGGTQIVDEGTVVTLDAANSVDTDDGIVDYRWEQLQGPAVDLPRNHSSTVSFEAPETGSEGASLSFQLTVTDAGGLQDTDTCLVTVTWVNMPPQADAGPDQQVNVGDEIVLDGSLSTDPDGQAITAYHWRQTDGAPVELSDATAAKPVFQVPEVDMEGGSLAFELTVTDEGGLEDTDTCLVTIPKANNPPQADAGPDQQVNVGDEVVLDGSLSTDPDDQAITAYHWRQTDGAPVELSDATAAKPVFIVPEVGLGGDMLTFELTVKDSGDLLSTDTCQVVVAEPVPAVKDTTPPSLTIKNPASSTVTLGTFRMTMSGTAWDDQALEKVTWVNNRGGSGVVSGTTQWQIGAIRLGYGTNVISITATDTAGNQTTVSRTVKVDFRWWLRWW